VASTCEISVPSARTRANRPRWVAHVAPENGGLAGQLLAAVVARRPHAVHLLPRDGEDLVLVGEDGGGGIGADQHRHAVVLEDLPHVVEIATAQRDEVGEVGAKPPAGLVGVHGRHHAPVGGLRARR
jgi:hypothetical protein